MFLLFLYMMLVQTEGEAREEAHANDVFHSIFIVAKELFSSLNALTAYSYTHNPAMKDRYLASRNHIMQEFKTLHENLKDYPEQHKQLEKTERLEMRAVKLCDGLKESFEHDDIDIISFMQIKGMRTQMEALMEQTIAELRELNDVVQVQSGASSEAGLAWRRNAKLLLLLGVAANILFSILLVVLFSREITNRLRVLNSNASRLAEGQKLLPRIRGDDEISELDKVFHRMAVTIEESNKKQRALVDNSVDVICSIDKDNVFTTVSPASERVWGFPDSELVGRKLTDIIAPEDVEETLRSLSTIKKVESTVGIENRVKCKDGKTINVLWSVYWSQQEETLYCVAHDITVRKVVEGLVKESEARIRRFMEDLPVGLVVVDAQGRIQLANHKMQEMFDYRSLDLVDKNVLGLFNYKDPDGKSWLNELIASESGHAMELIATRSDGTKIPVELSRSEVEVDKRQLYLVAITDVTERHEIERLKREFVAMVSHDLKTPLTSVRGMLVLLSEGATGKLPAKAVPVVKSAEGQLERLIKLINDLLDVQKMESGKFQIEAKSVSIRQLIEESFDVVERVADEAGVTVEIGNVEPTKVHADPERIIQVLVNLLSNAIKFSPEKGVVKVEALVTDKTVEVRVIDQGRGVPEKLRDEIFERFKQVETADATEKKGSGLGLAICKMIVEGHGGTIGVSTPEGTAGGDKPETGSMFWFRLPRTNA